MNDEAILKRRSFLKRDLPVFCENCLDIKTKAGNIERLKLNAAQMHLHRSLEKQKKEKGLVRAIVVKGRQQGCSTYIGARFYHQATTRRGCNVFILTHHQTATDNLFDMANLYHQNCPEEVKPFTGKANAKELSFERLHSGYNVGTAGSVGIGRSSTIQLFHGSEVPSWKNAPAHLAGIMQAVPFQEGTEAILESTALGMGNIFHQIWQEAEAGASFFIPVFIPWFWSPEYAIEPSPDFHLDEEDTAYQRAHNLTTAQMVWRRMKIQELRDPALFKQEYPATSDEAFQSTSNDSYIQPELVLQARKTRVKPQGALVIGVDPARFGDDRFSIAWRQGRCVSKIMSHTRLDTVAGANLIRRIIDEDDPDRVFVDVGGQGAGVIDILASWGGLYGPPPMGRVKAVNFGGAPFFTHQPTSKGGRGGGPRNRRAEMWMHVKEFLEMPGGVELPDIDTIQADLCAPGYKYDMESRLILESKEDMRARNIRSPDEGDAVALTFAEPVTPVKKAQVNTPLYNSGPEIGNSGWMGL